MKPVPTIALIALAGLAVAAAIWTTRSAQPGSSETSGAASSGSAGGGVEPGRAFVPGLESKVNSVAEIVITRPELAFTVHKVADRWRLKEKGDYPVKAETVRQVVLGLSELRELEPKTTRPEMYSKIGVDDPKAPAPDAKDVAMPQSTRVTLKDAGGATLADVIVGNRKPGATPATSSVFVRRNGEAQSWQCQGNLDVPRDQLAWLETQFANIDRARVQSVRVTPSDSADGMIDVSRASTSEAFKLANMPAGKELKDPGAPESIAGALTFATFVDVASASTVDFGAADGMARTFELRTFDGLLVRASSIVKDGKTWWKLAASMDEDAARAQASKTPDANKPDANKPEGSKPEGSAPTAEQIDAGVAKIKKEVEELNGKWSAYAFAPQDFKSRALNTTLGELVKDPAPATPPGADGTPTPGSAATMPTPTPTPSSMPVAPPR